MNSVGLRILEAKEDWQNKPARGFSLIRQWREEALRAREVGSWDGVEIWWLTSCPVFSQLVWAHEEKSCKLRGCHMTWPKHSTWGLRLWQHPGGQQSCRGRQPVNSRSREAGADGGRWGGSPVLMGFLVPEFITLELPSGTQKPAQPVGNSANLFLWVKSCNAGFYVQVTWLPPDSC